MDPRPFILAETTAVPGLIRGGLVLLALWMIGCGPGQSERVSRFQPAGPVEFNHDHPQLHKALEATVKDGWVDYASLRRGNADLDAFLQQAALVPRGQFDGWARAQRLAFLLNVYNASMLRLVATSEPVDNVKALGTWRQSVWDQPAVDLFGRRHSLGELEHDMIRGQFESPQVHFALVCGAQSCPPLRSEPYSADQLESQFADQAREFLRDDQKNRVDLDKKIVYLSQIFSWFRDDFGKTDADILKFVASHLGEAAAAEIREGGFVIQYTKYDWTLNDSSRKN